MRIDQLFRREVVAVSADESLAEAASRMTFNEVSALPVLEGGELIGILTERDVVQAVADERDPTTTAVAECMTPRPVTIAPDAEVSDAARAMLEIGARHLPVLDGGRLVGMLSARDLLEADAEWP